MALALRNSVTRERFDAVLFDLDGVLTATAKVHASCWKKMFDAFLLGRAAEEGKPFRPFDIAEDYGKYVDGKPRFDGVMSFLKTRGMELPYGVPDSPPTEDTVCGLGNRKDALVDAVLEAEGVEVYDGTMQWLRDIRRLGMKTAVVSSSKNCRAVLHAAGIEDLFEGRLDGEVAERLELPGKPAPDTYLRAAADLGVHPKRSVVVEDAISGVQAGRAGGFGLVIGVARHSDREALSRNGADIVVNDLGELSVRIDPCL